MRTVKEYSIDWTADHEQYWQGHGVTFSHYEECATGCGNTLAEAIEDCLEGLAQQDILISDEQEKEIKASITSDLRKPYTLETDIREVYCEHESEEDDDCAVCAGEWHYYVSIDVSLN